MKPSLHTRLFLASLAIAFIAPIVSWPAFAQTETERKACESDAQLHCPDEMPDRAKVQACLARNVNSLSPACKQLIENAGKRRHRVRGHRRTKTVMTTATFASPQHAPADLPVPQLTKFEFVIT